MQTPICVYINSIHLNVAANEVPAALAAAITEPVAVAAAKAANAALIDDRYEICGGTVIDHSTGLQWSRDDVAPDRLNHADYLTACTNCRAGGFDDWRPATLHEHNTIVDYTQHDPCINKTAFPTCKSGGYWTSTVYAANASFVWIQNFNDGRAGVNGRNGEFFGRAVRRVAPGQ